MNDLAGLLLVGYLGYRMGRNNPKPTPQRVPMSDCGRPHLSEIIPGLTRTTRQAPVIAQDQIFFRNLIENPYNFPQ